VTILVSARARDDDKSAASVYAHSMIADDRTRNVVTSVIRVNNSAYSSFKGGHAR
jgi:hypothetical protein